MGSPEAPPPERRVDKALRRYDDGEASAILERAAARETRPDLPAPHDPTLDDLMAAAAEVGLDPAEVRRAAAVVARGRPDVAERAIGGPSRREVTARLVGARIPSDAHLLVRLAEDALGGRGEVVESAPGRFLWQRGGAGSRSELSMTEADGALTLSAWCDRGGENAGLWFLGALAWAGLSALTPIFAWLPGVGKLAAFLLTPPLVAFPFRRGADRRLVARLERLAMDVLRLADDEAAIRARSAPGEPPPPRALPDGSAR